MTGDNNSHGEGDMWVHNIDRGNNNRQPHRGRKGPGHRPRATRGGRTDVGHGGGSRHVVRETETSGGGWRMVGGDEVQVDDVPIR